MSKIMKILLSVVLFSLTFVYAFAEVYTVQNGPRAGQKWDIRSFGPDSFYEGIGERQVPLIKDFLENRINKSQLINLLEATTCNMSPNCGLGVLRSFSDSYIETGCGNVSTASARLLCVDKSPAFTCEDLSINGRNQDANGNIVLYANHFTSPLEISGIQQTNVKESNCRKIGPNKANFQLRYLDSILADSSTAMFSEVTTVGSVLNNDMFSVTANGGGDFTTAGLYELDFYLFNGTTPLGIAAGNCSIQIIHAIDPMCGVNSAGGWNGEGNEELDTDAGEQCDITSDGTQLGVWGDGNPGCSETCQTINLCGDGIVNNGEQCDYNDPAEPWLDNNQTCNLSCELIDDPEMIPEISILKYSNNPHDLDGNNEIDPLNNVNIGLDENDHQLIPENTASKFQIWVKNIGNEGLINLNITDSEAPACNRDFAQTEALIQGVGNNDSVFDVDEAFTYDCELTNTENGYTNIVVITAEGKASGIPTPVAQDDSEVTFHGGSIGIEKYNGNIDDLDGMVTRLPLDDSQTVLEGNDAIFRIRVENTGTLDLEDLNLVDSFEFSCSSEPGVHSVLPAEQGNTPGIFIEKGGRLDPAELEDDMLQPGEYFVYSCIKQNSLFDYVNEIAVRAEIVSQPGVQVHDLDATDVVIATDSQAFCGTANGDVYSSSTTAFPDGETFCSDGNSPTPDPVPFPGKGSSTSWTCPDGSGGTVSCNASRRTGGGGGSTARCLDIDVSGTQVSCLGNNKVKTFRVDCDSSDGSNADNILTTDIVETPGSQGFEGIVDCPSVNEPICYVSKIDRQVFGQESYWTTRSVCKATGGGGGGPICPNANDPRCGVCEYHNDGSLQAGSPDTCPVMETIPWGAEYHLPTYANNEQNKLLCLKITDQFGNDVKTSVFDLMGGLPNDPIIENRGNKPPVLLSGLFTDQIKQEGQEAATIHQAALIDSHVCLLMSSKAPGVEKFEFDIWIPTHEETSEFIWDLGYRKITGATTSRKVEFRKPFTGEFAVVDGTLIPKINTKQTYDIKLTRENTSPGATYSDGVLFGLNSLSVETTTSGHQFSGNGIEVVRSQMIQDHAQFKATTRAVNNAAILLAPNIRSNDIKLKYTIGGQVVWYYLTDLDRGDDRTEFTLSGENQETLGLKIIGPLQGDGKADITGQDSNFSDISKGPLRGVIKQKAYEITAGMSSNQTASRVKYVKGEDVYLSERPSLYDTLVVEGGNVVITGDITGSSTMGIIALNGGEAGKEGNGVYVAGNIFVQPNVTQIDALIYGDGGLISANSIGAPYTTNSAARTSALSSQLVINGTIFTRNTIGGAVDGSSGDNRLPGGQVTNNFDQASIYDLNYLRTGSQGHLNNKDDGSWSKYSTVIRYTPTIQNNPPKGFGN